MIPQCSATGVLSESPLILIDVTLDNGVTDHGILFTYSKLALKSAALLVANLSELLVGEYCNPGKLVGKIALRFKSLGNTGIIGMAVSSIDMALWDAISRCSQVSLTHLMGGMEKRIPVYGGIGMDNLKASATLAETWLKGVLRH